MNPHAFLGQLFDLSARHVLLTGASSGLGRHFARTLTRAGARVALCARSVDKLEVLAAEIRAEGGRCEVYALDVRNRDDIRACVAAAEAVAPIDVLVNNAGIAHTAPIAQHSVADFERIQSVNTVGVFLGIRSVIDPMVRAGGGSIINISSGAGLRATKYMIAYAASKYAVTGMTASTAMELARHRIRVNSVHPGVIETPMLEINTPEMNEAMVRHAPMRRIGQPSEIAAAVLFLASDESSFMTGAHVPVDGGATI
jgi:3alpha(or 20beta)-hydroxysteroid dehydrogenase